MMFSCAIDYGQAGPSPRSGRGALVMHAAHEGTVGWRQIANAPIDTDFYPKVGLWGAAVPGGTGGEAGWTAGWVLRAASPRTLFSTEVAPFRHGLTAC